MFRFCKSMLVLATAASIALPGCNVSRQKMTEVELAASDDSSLYDSMGMHPEIPAVSVDDPFQSAITLPPITINEEEPPTYWELSLEEATRMALSNSRIMRDLGATVLKLPSATKTIQDPAITETDARFGTEAALSQFDAHFLTSGYFEKNDRALNNVFFGGGTRLLQQDTNVYQSQLTKRTATGAQMSLTNNTSYDSNNAPGNLFYGSWTTNIEAQVKQPLLAGGGIEYNRVYGPNGIPGLPAGVMLARVNTEQSLADFEVGVRNFISDVENAYWDLYFAYRDLDARILARNAALETWRRVNALHQAGKRGGEAQQEAQSREQYFRFQEEVQNALTGRATDGTRSNNGSGGGTFRGGSGVHFAERRLRLMIGSHISDGRLIRPADEPKMARALFEWDVILAESLTRRPELRKQKWLIKRREMEVSATKNLLQPRLDATGMYRWRGFGKQLMTYTDPSDRGQFASAWGNLLNGNFQEWQLGFELEVPLGFRHAHNAVRNYELMLARERSILNEQERAVVLDLSNAIGELNRSYTVMQTNHNRRISAKQQLAAIRALDDPTPQTLYLELEAQRRLADAESQYYRALVEYELAVKNVHFEKGSLLEYNNVMLAELPWPEKAYKDAYEKIRLRTRAGRLAEKVVQGPDQIVSEGVMPQGYLAAPGSGPTPETVPPALPEKLPSSTPGQATPLVPKPAAEPIPSATQSSRAFRPGSTRPAPFDDDLRFEQTSAEEPPGIDNENEFALPGSDRGGIAEDERIADDPGAGAAPSAAESAGSQSGGPEDGHSPDDDEDPSDEG
jgi:outer membrane protein TolC